MQMIRVGGVNLELEQIAATGDPPRAPIVFLHEGLGSVAMWRGWPTRVCRATGRAGIVYSRRGYGRSDPVPDVRAEPSKRDGRRIGRLTPDYMHLEAWEVLPELLRLLGIERPVLLGHSDGGSIALLYASRHPVTACIVLAPHVIVEDISVRSIAEARDAYLTTDLRERLARYHADVDCAFWQWNDIWLDPAFRSFDIRADCERITAPLLAIQGVDDAYGTMQQIEQIRPSQLTPVLQKLEHCGHSPHRDQPALTAQLVTDFLAPLG
ncbi:MAG: benzoate degradation ring-cleavage hydrolase [Burkholderiaceae bacterium]|jgi:pimeloyl-ACP methyl ester carboxylesterase|nr:MAG: benzoate degradation ring-cleavage hydrolase [Burkholderiaceae bacterium]